MKTGKRGLGVLLAVVMVVCAVPVTNLPKAKAEGTSYQVGDIIEFGEYPQSLIGDSATISLLNACESDWQSYGYYTGSGEWRDGQMQPSDYMQYCDVYCSGNKYRGVRFSQYRPKCTGAVSSANTSFQDENGYVTGQTYWFKYEPLFWRVLDPTDGLVICFDVIDSQPYNNYVLNSGTDPRGNTAFWGDAQKTYYANDYTNSSIRKWLNETFYVTAFNTEQQNRILSTHHQNNDGYFTLTGDDNHTDFDSLSTDDKAFLISYDEATNTSYGFSSSNIDNEMRQAQGTDYAKSQGLYVYTENNRVIGNSWWWLRTPGSDSQSACSVRDSGYISDYYNDVNEAIGGIRPAMCVDLDEIAKLQSEEAYISKHISFASATTMPEAFGFYNTVWSEENGKRLGWVKTWEVVGDIGEVATFKFDDLEITADFYELFLSDIILKFTEQCAPEFELKAFDLFQEYHGKIKKALKSTAEWEESVADGSTVDMEIDSILLDPDFECSGNTATVFSKLLGKFYQNHQDTFTEIFSGLDKAAAICEAITDAADIGKAFAEAYQAYTVTMAYQQVSQKFFTVMYQAANRMENQQYANWFKRALNQYFALANSGDALFEASLHLCKDMATMAFDRVAKDVVKNLTYQTVANLLGCTAGPVAIVTFTYSATYGLLDKICGLDKQTKAYEIMNYIAPVEKAMSELENSYATILIGSQTLESAQDYDYFYNLYKQVNMYLYQAAYDFRSAAWPSKNKTVEMEIFSRCIDQWKRSSCHTGLSAATVRKYSSVCCPVDVYVYNAEGDLILEIINDEIVSCDDSITALTFDGKKSILYPADQDYTIRIVAREDGDMSYYVSEIQEDSSERQVEFYDIPLSKNQVFTGEIPQPLDVSKEAYSLTTGEETVACNYDSAEQNGCADGHSVTTWTTSLAATCVEEGEQVGYCESCGKEVFETLPVSQTHNTILVNASPATCTEAGYTGDQYCTVCKQVITPGETIQMKAHTLVLQNAKAATCTEAGYTGDQYCTVCQQVITAGTAINALGHADLDENGDCPRCHAHIQDVEQPTAPQSEPEQEESAPKLNFFQRLIQWIKAFFAKLFGR